MNKRLEAHRIPGTSILVDAFRKPVGEPGFEYVLSHFHGDHYGRLSERWDQPVHCSPLTGRLVVAVLGVREELVRTHGLREQFELGGASVEFLDAEHCPGAVMVLAAPRCAAEQHLHTGDFRATPRLMEAMRQLERPKVHTLLLDSTYALAKSSFPDQREFFKARLLERGYKAAEIDKALQVIERIADDLSGAEPSTLIVVAAYSVGKERVILRVAEKLDCKIYAGSERKRSIYSILDMSDEERGRFTLEPAEAQIHVVPFGFCGEIWPFYQPNFAKCEEYLGSTPFTSLVGVLPTGHADASNWNRRHEVVSKGRVTLRLYAYSEHSSAEELSAFVGLVRPVKLVPTVSRDEKEATAIVRRFQSLLDQAGAARQLFGAKAGGGGRSAPAAGAVETAAVVVGAAGIAGVEGCEKGRPGAAAEDGRAGAVAAVVAVAVGAAEATAAEGAARAAVLIGSEEGRPRGTVQAGRFAQLGASAGSGSICLDVSDDEGPCAPVELDDRPCAGKRPADDLSAGEAERSVAEGAGCGAAAAQVDTARDAAIAAVLAGCERDLDIEEARSLLQSHGWDVSAALSVAQPVDKVASPPKQRRLEGAGRQASLRSFFGSGA